MCFTVFAILALDYSVASTISQCSMLITSAWGILLFGELGGDRLRLGLFLSGGVVIICGAAMVSYYGTTS